MTPADRRVTELIDKWLASIDLHLQYVELSDAAYARAQPWPKHDRPSRWVLEVARQKVLELKTQLANRQAKGDGKFAESLELMAFLANLVGVQHIQRFIPLAAAPSPETSQTVEAPAPIKTRAAPARDDATREMPRLKPQGSTVKSAAPAPPAHAQPQSRVEPMRTAAARPAPARPAPVVKSAPAADLKAKIIGDAVRLLKWGKPWHELAELIARIADRPAAAEIRKILRAHKSEIERKAAAG